MRPLSLSFHLAAVLALWAGFALAESVVAIGDTRLEVLQKMQAQPSKSTHSSILGVPGDRLAFRAGLSRLVVVTLVFDRVVAVEERRASLLENLLPE
jgi:hypothetical protein